ncbi:MAG: DUF3109 family protein [Opitutaceae bacterium]
MHAKPKRPGARSRPGPVRLERCDLRQCEAMCCYDGAYLEPDDEERIAAALKHYPEFFRHLPTEYIVEENWRGFGTGRKTAKRPWAYRRKIPAHFTATRCVFTDDNGCCTLESAARAHDLHPWTFKPTTCFLFPMPANDPDCEPVRPGEDPHDLGSEYPGYATIIDCGKHRPEGRPWREVLREEFEIIETPIDLYFNAWQASVSE